ncbi:unnamed protein product [Chrysoparadoxa australica]
MDDIDSFWENGLLERESTGSRRQSTASLVSAASPEAQDNGLEQGSPDSDDSQQEHARPATSSSTPARNSPKTLDFETMVDETAQGTPAAAARRRRPRKGKASPRPAEPSPGDDASTDVDTPDFTEPSPAAAGSSGHQVVASAKASSSRKRERVTPERRSQSPANGQAKAGLGSESPDDVSDQEEEDELPQAEDNQGSDEEAASVDYGSMAEDDGGALDDLGEEEDGAAAEYDSAQEGGSMDLRAIESDEAGSDGVRTDSGDEEGEVARTGTGTKGSRTPSSTSGSRGRGKGKATPGSRGSTPGSTPGSQTPAAKKKQRRKQGKGPAVYLDTPEFGGTRAQVTPGSETGEKAPRFVPVTELEQPGRTPGMRRSQRHRVPALQWWKNERIVYKTVEAEDHEAVEEEIIGFIKGKPTPAQNNKKRSRTGKSGQAGVKRMKALTPGRLPKDRTYMDEEDCCVIWDEEEADAVERRIVRRTATMNYTELTAGTEEDEVGYFSSQACDDPVSFIIYSAPSNPTGIAVTFTPKVSVTLGLPPIPEPI